MTDKDKSSVIAVVMSALALLILASLFWGCSKPPTPTPTTKGVDR